MNVDELQQIADDYVDTAAKKKEIDETIKTLKSNIVSELEKVEDEKFDFRNGLTAAKQKRQGSFDMKALQVKYNISDADLDTFRKPSTSYWVLKTK